MHANTIIATKEQSLAEVSSRMPLQRRSRRLFHIRCPDQRVCARPSPCPALPRQEASLVLIRPKDVTDLMQARRIVCR